MAPLFDLSRWTTAQASARQRFAPYTTLVELERRLLLRKDLNASRLRAEARKAGISETMLRDYAAQCETAPIMYQAERTIGELYMLHCVKQ